MNKVGAGFMRIAQFHSSIHPAMKREKFTGGILIFKSEYYNA